MIMDNGMVKWYNNGTTLYHFQKVSNLQSLATAGGGKLKLLFRSKFCYSHMVQKWNEFVAS